MVWIHGGGYNTGSASDALYNGVAFATQGIVFVSIQYRLNVLGFYDFSTYPDGGRFDTNCGLSDQILAIRWIHENIQAFGGDPDRITIAGESAGDTSVATLLAAPAVRGLFQQAIVQSAIPEAIFSHTVARKNMDLFLEGMGWTEKDLPNVFDL
jgi:para-nitrobenzyl esterase